MCCLCNHFVVAEVSSFCAGGCCGIVVFLDNVVVGEGDRDTRWVMAASWIQGMVMQWYEREKANFLIILF